MKYKIPMTTTITGKNQITLPAAIAAKLGLTNGTRIEWTVGRRPDEIRGRILPDPATLAAQLHGAGRAHLRKGQDPLRDLLRERELDDRDDAAGARR